MTLYYGNAKIKDTNEYGVYVGNRPIGAIYKGSERVYFVKKSYTYTPTGSFQTYTAPKWVTKIRVDCVAARGTNSNTTTTERAGKGGRVQCDLTVTPGQTLYIFAGNIPTQGTTAEYNASDVRTNNAGITNATSLQSRLVVAGGGGNSRYPNPNRHYYGSGGNGGGLTGGNGTAGGYDSKAGTGGTQSAGGTTGGTFGLGGGGNDNNAGGAGWYGGGRGTTTGHNSVFYTGGGGGGSSYTSSTLCSNVTHTQGYGDGAGYVTITEIG